MKNRGSESIITMRKTTIRHSDIKVPGAQREVSSWDTTEWIATYRVVLRDPSGCAATGSGKTTAAEAMPVAVEVPRGGAR